MDITHLKKCWWLVGIDDLEWIHQVFSRIMSGFLCYFFDLNIWLANKVGFHVNWKVLLSSCNTHHGIIFVISNHTSDTLHSEAALHLTSPWLGRRNDYRGNKVYLWNYKNWENSKIGLFLKQSRSLHEEIRCSDRRNLNQLIRQGIIYFYWFSFNFKIDHDVNWSNLFQRITSFLDISFQHHFNYRSYDITSFKALRR